MLPERLSIKGLYSYQQRTEIDFQPLTRAGIFGIFGPVGSGKSSILEAITFALYGESNRLNAREARGYNMMNLKSSELEIDFVFTHREDRFRFTVQAKRKKSKFEEVKSPDRRAFKEEDGQWVPLPSNDATDLLGLKYEHFRQIVIIPQGKFQEFVHKSPTERSDMLRELFPLDVYDLSDPLRTLRAENSRAITRVETQLNELAGANPEEVGRVEKELRATRKQIEKISAAKAKTEASVREGERVKQLLERQVSLEEQVRNLEERQEEMDREEAELKRYESARNDFGDLFLRLDKWERQQQEAYAKREQVRQKLEGAEKDWEKLKKKKQTILDSVGGLEAHDEQLRRMEAARQGWQLQASRAEHAERLKKAEEERERAENQQKKQAEHLRALHKQREKLTRELRQRNQLTAWQASFDLEDQIRKRLEEIEQSLKREHRQLKELEAEKNAWVKKLISLDKSFHSWAREETEGILKEIQQALKKIREDRLGADAEKEKCLKKAGLSQYAEELQEDEPCPLCGSRHHPELFHDGAEREMLLHLEKRLKELARLHDVLILAERDGKAWLTRKAAQQEAVKRKEEAAREVQRELEACLEKRDPAGAMDRERLAQAWQEVREKEEQQDQIDRAILQRESEAKSEEEVAQLREQVQDLRVEAARLEEAYAQRKAQAGEDWLEIEPEKLAERQDELMGSRAQLEAILAKEVDCEKALHKWKSEFRSASERAEHVEGEVAEIGKQIEKRLIDHAELADRQAAKELLQKQIVVEEVRKRIRAFREELVGSQSALSTLREQTKGQTFDPEALEKQQAAWRDQERQLTAAQNRIGELQGRLADLKEKQKRKKERQKDLKALEARREDLKTMESLFRSRGFVQYVSTIYLQQLCALANERFRKLTQNRLQLELDEKYQFVVRDFLHGGRSRSIKTLSGGQTFQAALCLALALSEQIQAHQDIRQPFFFLDEGFGTLDRDSLALVFDTLKQLRKENRTVGIISHVEDLQNEIDHYLRVMNDEEKGSWVVMER